MLRLLDSWFKDVGSVHAVWIFCVARHLTMLWMRRVSITQLRRFGFSLACPRAKPATGAHGSAGSAERAQRIILMPLKTNADVAFSSGASHGTQKVVGLQQHTACGSVRRCYVVFCLYRGAMSAFVYFSSFNFCPSDTFGASTVCARR